MTNYGLQCLKETITNQKGTIKCLGEGWRDGFVDKSSCLKSLTWFLIPRTSLKARYNCAASVTPACLWEDGRGLGSQSAEAPEINSLVYAMSQRPCLKTRWKGRD